MLVVKTFVKKSGIYGLGCFALHDIPLAALVWVYNKAEMILALREYASTREYEFYGFYDKRTEMYVLPKDNAMYIKMVDSRDIYNVKASSDGTMRANRYINKGDELLELYDDYMIAEDIDRYKIAEENEKKYKAQTVDTQEEAMRYMQEGMSSL